jgi:N-acetyl sugar amidotransferase
MDTTVPGIRFDEKGECNFCKVHDLMEGRYPLDEKGRRTLDSLLQKIRGAGRNGRYDCVIGVSGGRDSTYTLYLVKELGLRPLAVHFNDGFGNPVAGENIKNATRRLGVDLRTVTSDWRESKDLKIAFLKASTPDMEEGTDIGIATSLYGTAAKERIGYILTGHSFRTEGISPLEWCYLDGGYLRDVHRRFGSVPLRKWKPEDPGFNLGLYQMFYYTVVRRIKTIPILNYVKYDRREAEAILKGELGWVYPGAHYFDDLYQSLMTYLYRVKFGIDRRKFNYSALIRSGQMTRKEAFDRIGTIYVIEDPKVIDLCIKRLGLTDEQFRAYASAPVKTFRDYRTNYRYIKALKYPIKLMSMLHLIPSVTYDKYFGCD